MNEEPVKQLRDRIRITRVSAAALRSQPEPGSADVGRVAEDLAKVLAAMGFVVAEDSAPPGAGPA